MSDLEKQPLRSASLPLHYEQPSVTIITLPAPSRWSRWTAFAIRLTILSSLLLLFTNSAQQHWRPEGKHAAKHGTQCKQQSALAPAASDLDKNKDLVFSNAYRSKSVDLLSQAVQLHTESFDDNGSIPKQVGDAGDTRWNNFFAFASYLEATFPVLHQKMALAKVNTHGLVFTWTGSDSKLKPLLLMAHQDTVPVNPQTVSDWTHPPWSGHYDGTYLWGRGSSDCKNTLIALLESATLLIDSGFEPKRTIILAFGFDEESKGYQGAGEISKVLNSIYGDDGIGMIVDEGGLGIGEKYGAIFALPSTGEKGYLDVNITLHTTGGHSSVPPPHTNIGILASSIVSLEADPYAPSLSLKSPIFNLLQCAAEYGDLPRSLRGSIGDSTREGKKGARARQQTAESFAELGATQRYLVSTSQAVDVIHGGVKVNALPETSSVVVNYRVSVDSSTSVVKNRVAKHMVALARKFHLDLEVFGEKSSFALKGKVSGGLLVVNAINELSPAPVSREGPEWDLLAGTIKHAYSDQYPDIVVAPSIMTGNTDTRFHWNNSKNIFRFTPSSSSLESSGIHTVDEHLLFDEHIRAVWFFHELVRNANEL